MGLKVVMATFQRELTVASISLGNLQLFLGESLARCAILGVGARIIDNVWMVEFIRMTIPSHCVGEDWNKGVLFGDTQ